MKDRNSLSKKSAAMVAMASLSAAVIMSMACLTGPDNSAPPGPPWETKDSVWKVIENLEYAYNAMDLDLYMSCFREDFEFHLLWWYNPHGKPAKQDSFWGYDVEEQFHQNMFAYVDSIELTVEGTQGSPWSGDSTGQSYQLPRTFNLWIYTDKAQTGFYRACGSALFVCRQDTTDDQWYVWQWWDLSDTKDWTTWGQIKTMF
ncbi:MAG: hypothetical protein KAT09_05445 [Candidatus Aegiribacteria sp.]|nr:hypothetical protein [Candidatus Aegiribacteria sp.]